MKRLQLTFIILLISKTIFLQCLNNLQQVDKYLQQLQNGWKFVQFSEKEFLYSKNNSSFSIKLNLYKEQKDIQKIQREQEIMKTIKSNFYYQLLNQDQNCFYKQNEDQSIQFVQLLKPLSIISLQNFVINSNNANFIDQTLWKWFFIYQMLLIIQQYHQQGYVHLNISDQNILMQNSFWPILYDFSQSYKIERLKLGKKKLIGNAGFIDSECIKQKQQNEEKIYYSQKSDVYSLGVTIFYLFFPNSRKIEDKNEIFNYEIMKKDQIECKDFNLFENLIINMIKEKQNERPTISMLLKQMKNILLNILAENYDQNSDSTFYDDFMKEFEKIKIQNSNQKDLNLISEIKRLMYQYKMLIKKIQILKNKNVILNNNLQSESKLLQFQIQQKVQNIQIQLQQFDINIEQFKSQNRMSHYEQSTLTLEQFKKPKNKKKSI